jgi:hypothetical protein
MAVGDKTGLNKRGLQEVEQLIKSSGDDVRTLMARPDVSDEAKLVASAILHAGAWIAMAVDANGRG